MANPDETRAKLDVALGMYLLVAHLPIGHPLREERAGRYSDALAAHEAALRAEALDPPKDARGRLLLNAYGRQCYDLGVAEATPQWQDISTAPKGSWEDGPTSMKDPAYVDPPHIWLELTDGHRCVGYADAYYAERGNGYDGGSFWVEEFSGERVTPVRWMPLPASVEALQS